MTITVGDLARATQLCAGCQPLYRGPNPLSAGRGLEEAADMDAAVDEAWAAWSAFARNYFMAMLNTLGGVKPLALELDIGRFCSPAEALGARAALDVFWRRELALSGPVERRGAHALNPMQRAILADDAVNEVVFRGTERAMEGTILQMLRGRRNLLQELNVEGDHAAGLQDDIAFFFGGGRPAPLPLKMRNENFDMTLL